MALIISTFLANILIGAINRLVEGLREVGKGIMYTTNMYVYFSFQKKLDVPPTIFMNVSRGCFYRCIFCATPILWPGKVRRFSPERVIEEMKYHHKKYPAVNIGFLDDCFFSDEQWLSQFLALVSPLEIRYNCIGRIDTLERDTIEELVKTGCAFIAFGVETGSQSRQRQIRKNLNLGKLRDNIKILSKFDCSN